MSKTLLILTLFILPSGLTAQLLEFSYTWLKHPDPERGNFDHAYFHTTSISSQEQTLRFISFPGKGRVDSGKVLSSYISLRTGHNSLSYNIDQIGYNLENQFDFTEKPTQLSHRIHQESVVLTPGFGVLFQNHPSLSLSTGFTLVIRLPTANYSVGQGNVPGYDHIFSKVNVSGSGSIYPEIRTRLIYALLKHHKIALSGSVFLFHRPIQTSQIMQTVNRVTYFYQVQVESPTYGFHLSYLYQF